MYIDRVIFFSHVTVRLLFESISFYHGQAHRSRAIPKSEEVEKYTNISFGAPAGRDQISTDEAPKLECRTVVWRVHQSRVMNLVVAKYVEGLRERRAAPAPAWTLEANFRADIHAEGDLRHHKGRKTGHDEEFLALAVAKPVVLPSKGGTHHLNINDQAVWKQSPGSRAVGPGTSPRSSNLLVTACRAVRSRRNIGDTCHTTPIVGVTSFGHPKRNGDRLPGTSAACRGVGPRTTSGTAEIGESGHPYNFWGGTGEIGLWVREQHLDDRSYDHMFSIGELARS
ncbi:hypothetical protein DFH09DRAFT_1102727 [Mycena vulgaris]|nr:hypothetical protein DFH09DRAFT_1102727 [Mycena vulgaris]